MNLNPRSAPWMHNARGGLRYSNYSLWIYSFRPPPNAIAVYPTMTGIRSVHRVVRNRSAP